MANPDEATGHKPDMDKRTKHFKQHRFKAVIAAVMVAVMCFFVLPCETFAGDESSSRAERLVIFTYGYTECTGEVHSLSDSSISYEENTGSTYPEYFSTYMMLCDTDHKLRMDGYDVSDDKVTFTSSNPAVLEIDSEGNVTLKKTGTVRITATVAEDEVYAERRVYLDVKVDRHEGWIDSIRAHYADRPASWGLALDINDEPQQLVLNLRPGASVTYTPESPSIISIDDGMVTPLKIGTTQIWFDVDDGGGRYKACRFGETVIVSGEDMRSDQEITGDLGPFTIDWHDGLTLDLHANTDLEYSVISGEYARVDQNGVVEFTHEGTAVIKVVAAASGEYKQAEATISITAVDYAAEEAARLAAEEAARLAAEEAARKAEEEARLAAEEAARLAAETAAQNNGGDDSQNDAGSTGTDNSSNPQNVSAGTTQNSVGGTSQNNAGSTGTGTASAPSSQNADESSKNPSGTVQIIAQKGVVTTVTAARQATAATASARKEAEATQTAAQKAEAATRTAVRKAKKATAKKAASKSQKKTARRAVRTAAQKAELANAKSLKKPKLKVRPLKGRKNKLTWSKVSNADGYIIYVKYPGRKKYVKATTRDNTVKSVTHKGLSLKKVYKYKVRAFKTVNGKIYYSPYSKVRKARVR